MTLPVAPLVLSFLVAASGAVASPLHLPIVERTIDFHGGELYERSETRMTLGSAGGSFDLRVRRVGGLYEIEVAGTLPDGTPRRALVTNDSVREWRGGEELALDEEGTARTRRFVQARVWFPFLPYGLLGDAVRHQDQGLERWGDRTLHRVKVTFAPGPDGATADEYAFWLDPATGRVEQYAYAYDRGTPQGGLRFRTAHRYRRVGGILFYDVHNFGIDRPDVSVDQVDPAFVAGLQAISEVELTEIEVREPSAASADPPR